MEIRDKEIKVSAPAKINLTLDVTGVRTDGYHELCMVMQTISLADTLTVRCIPEGEIRLSMNRELPDGLPAKDNLVCRAVDALRERYPRCGGVEMYLEKKIPAAAGLAGGSADCAAALIAVNQLYELHLTEDELCRIGVTLGADVPFCIKKGTVLCEGIGEKMTPLPALPTSWCVLVKPDIAVSTPEVYQALDQVDISEHPDNEGMLDAIRRKDVADAARKLANVLETVTIPRYPIIAKIKSYLMEQGALGVLMSGSGPTTFGLFQDEVRANMAYRAAKADFPEYEVFLCHSLHPRQ